MLFRQPPKLYRVHGNRQKWTSALRDILFNGYSHILIVLFYFALYKISIEIDSQPVKCYNNVNAKLIKLGITHSNRNEKGLDYGIRKNT